MWSKDLIPMLCKKHLIGMHGELHKFRHNFVKQHSISGRIKPIVQIEPEAMKARHDEIAAYFKGHKSPYEQPDLSYLPDSERYAKIDLNENIKTLCARCAECRKNILGGVKMWRKFKNEEAWKKDEGSKILKLVQHYEKEYFYLVVDMPEKDSYVVKIRNGTSEEAHFTTKEKAILFAKDWMKYN
jgi:hypothetical protein